MDVCKNWGMDMVTMVGSRVEVSGGVGNSYIRSAGCLSAPVYTKSMLTGC